MLDNFMRNTINSITNQEEVKCNTMAIWKCGNKNFSGSRPNHISSQLERECPFGTQEKRLFHKEKPAS